MINGRKCNFAVPGQEHLRIRLLLAPKIVFACIFFITQKDDREKMEEA